MIAVANVHECMTTCSCAMGPTERDNSAASVTRSALEYSKVRFINIFLRFPLQRVVVVLNIAKVARVCCAASTNECHTLATLVVAHGSVQQPGHNPVAVLTCCSQSPLPYTVNIHKRHQNVGQAVGYMATNNKRRCSFPLLPSFPEHFMHAEGENSLVNGLFRFRSLRFANRVT